MNFHKYLVCLHKLRNDSTKNHNVNSPTIKMKISSSSLLGGFAVAPTQVPKVMTGNGQLTRDAFMINDFLRNPHFNWHLPELKFLQHRGTAEDSWEFKPAKTTKTRPAHPHCHCHCRVLFLQIKVRLRSNRSYPLLCSCIRTIKIKIVTTKTFTIVTR